MNKLRTFYRDIISRHRIYFLALMLTGLLWAILTTATPYTLKLLMDSLTEQRGSTIFPMGYFVLYIGLWMLQAVNHRFVDWLFLRLLPKIRHEIINDMFAYLSRHSLSYFQNNFAGSLQNKIADLTSGTIAIMRRADDSFAQLVGLIIAFVSMFMIHPNFALVLLAWSVSFIGVAIYFNQHIAKLSYEFSTMRTQMVGKIVDVISNMFIVTSFARNHDEQAYIDGAVCKTVNADRNLQKSVLLMYIGFDITIIVMIALMVWNLISLYLQGKVTIGDFAFIMMLVVNIFMALWWLASQFVEFSEDLGKSIQAISILSVPHEIQEYAQAQPLQIAQGKIEFHDVSFHYNDGESLFANKNVTIHAGEKVGLVGFSGSGKSSFINLILRNFDLESGRILIDNQDISQVTLDSLRGSIALIPQESSLFHRSLMENIRYGKLDATDAEVQRAAQIAKADEFIQQLPLGYDTLVGERGVKLSGGQRQRIAIARAILKDAPILIMDEATAALDSVTEKAIQQQLHMLFEGKTAIVIAHRLSTLAEMDRILVFDAGQIIEDGSHDELLQAQGHYRKLWDMQAGGFLPS